MDDTHKLYEQIEAYLSGLMKAEERQLFEEKMIHDQSLKEEVESFRMALNAITAKGRDEIRSSVDAAFEKHQAELKPATKTFTLRRALSVAAAVLLLAVATFILLPDNEAMSPQELFVAHFDLPAISKVRSEVTINTENWQQVLTFFEEKQFQDFANQVAPLLEKPDFEFRNEAYLLLGLSHLELKNNPEALAAFEKVSRASSSGKDADWYVALTYLKMEDLEKAKISFQQIVDSNSPWNNTAKKILKALGK